ncbi:MAG TPA: CBS domain-containing protein [Dissulfurispiraceae bacterium]|nr:CBS domain-containing protein [Dissulfurispiraceae bacterium]
MHKERVAQCMRRGAITCSEETSLHFVAQIMVVNRIRYCTIVNANHEVRGLISADNMLNAFGRDFNETTVKEILNPDTIVTVTLGTPIEDAVALMAQKGIEHLVVVSERAGSRAVIGIVCANDIVAKMARRQELEVLS